MYSQSLLTALKLIWLPTHALILLSHCITLNLSLPPPLPNWKHMTNSFVSRPTGRVNLVNGRLKSFIWYQTILTSFHSNLQSQFKTSSPKIGSYLNHMDLLPLFFPYDFWSSGNPLLKGLIAVFHDICGFVGISSCEVGSYPILITYCKTNLKMYAMHLLFQE